MMPRSMPIRPSHSIPMTGALSGITNICRARLWDLDIVYERVLVDVDGQPVVLTIGKDGILWKLNRETGEYLDLTETVYQNIFSEVDRERGRLTYREDIREQGVDEWITACPSTAGGHNWHPTAYDPGTQRLVIPLSQTCMEIAARGDCAAGGRRR